MRKSLPSFTLIELLIVITIIGILAVALVPRISQGPARARDTQRKADLGTLSTAMELYLADNGDYPPGKEGQGSYPSINNCLGATSTPINTEALLIPYLSSGTIPLNPTENPGANSICLWNDRFDFAYLYQLFSANSYLLVADLENSNARGDNIYCDVDWKITSSVADLAAYPCSPTSTYNYFVLSK
jgi:prepilin-type N-terminal cleavage/methylation domain-containing protein